jgi:hypothetical protein
MSEQNTVGKSAFQGHTSGCALLMLSEQSCKARAFNSPASFAAVTGSGTFLFLDFPLHSTLCKILSSFSSNDMDLITVPFPVNL